MRDAHHSQRWKSNACVKVLAEAEQLKTEGLILCGIIEVMKGV